MCDGVLYNAILAKLIFDFEQVKGKHPLNKEFCTAFGANLRRIRLEKGLGMREFAIQADMEYSQLSKIERGVTNPTISTACHLAEALGVAHTELFNFRYLKKEKR